MNEPMMNRVARTILLAGPLWLLAVGCNMSSGPKQATPGGNAESYEGMRQISDAGGPVAVSVGETFVVRLPYHPSTGYRWRLVPTTPPLLQVVDAKSTVDDTIPVAKNPLLGPGGYEYWTFKALKKGKTSFVFESFRGDGEPMERKTYNVKVG